MDLLGNVPYVVPAGVRYGSVMFKGRRIVAVLVIHHFPAMVDMLESDFQFRLNVITRDQFMSGWLAAMYVLSLLPDVATNG